MYVSCRLVRSYLVVLYDISINIKCELKTSNTNILLEPTSASMHPTSTSNSNNAQNWCDFPYTLELNSDKTGGKHCRFN